MKLIVTIPAFNEAATIGSVIREIPRRLDGVDCVEVLVCDDGSDDGTSAVARAAGADHVVRLKRNFGLTIAFASALQAALESGADILANIDADGQYDPSEISRLIQPILDGSADFVSGDRGVHALDHMPRSKRYGNQAGSFLLRHVAGSPVIDASSGFRAFTRDCALRLNPTIGHTYTHQSLIQAAHSGMTVKEVPVSFRATAREHGKSRLVSGVGVHIFKSVATIIRTLTTYKPLAVLGTIGVFFLVAGGLVGLIPIVNYLQQGSTSGHLQSLITSGILVLMGLQMIVFGLLADTVAANRRLTEEAVYRLRRDSPPHDRHAVTRADGELARVRSA